MPHPSNVTNVASLTADLIIKYGFLGVGLALVIIIAPIIYAIWKSRTLTAVAINFGLAFIITWGVLDVVQQYFPYLIASKRALLYGVVIKVPNGYQVQIASDLRKVGSAYLKRENDADDRNLSSFMFLLVAVDRPNCLSLAIANTNPRSETGASAFKIMPISDSDLKNDTDIVVEAQQQADKTFQLSVWRESGEKMLGKALVLKPLDNDTPGCAAGQSATLLDRLSIAAFAQSDFRDQNYTAQFQDYSARLKDDDLFTRRDARIQLSKESKNSLELTKQFLNSDNYRLQLGALVALSLKPEGDRKNLPPDILSKIREFKTNSDPTIHDTASRIEVPSP